MASSQPAIHLVPATAHAAAKDNLPTVCAVAALGMMLSNVLHEGLGHAATALLTVSPSGVLSTVAWNSAYDSKAVDAGGTIANLAAAAVFWLVLRRAAGSSVTTRLFLLLACAFNLFAGTGYFLFSGVTNFGDWAAVIDGLQPHALWRGALIVAGVLAYWGALIFAGTALFRHVGVFVTERRRVTRLMLTGYLAAVAIACCGGLLNPMGVKYVLLSSIPATAGAGSGLLYMQYYARREASSGTAAGIVNRSFPWMGVSAVCALLFIFVLGPGIHLSR
jgi:hypothetical protein